MLSSHLLHGLQSACFRSCFPIKFLYIFFVPPSEVYVCTTWGFFDFTVTYTRYEFPYYWEDNIKMALM